MLVARPLRPLRDASPTRPTSVCPQLRSHRSGVPVRAGQRTRDGPLVDGRAPAVPARLRRRRAVRAGRRRPRRAGRPPPDRPAGRRPGCAGCGSATGSRPRSSSSPTASPCPPSPSTRRRDRSVHGPQPGRRRRLRPQRRSCKHFDRPLGAVAVDIGPRGHRRRRPAASSRSTGSSAAPCSRPPASHAAVDGVTHGDAQLARRSTSASTRATPPASRATASCPGRCRPRGQRPRQRRRRPRAASTGRCTTRPASYHGSSLTEAGGADAVDRCRRASSARSR